MINLPLLLLFFLTSLNTGWIGSVLLWKRLSYVIDGMAHSLLFAVIISELYQLTLTQSIFVNVAMSAAISIVAYYSNEFSSFYRINILIYSITITSISVLIAHIFKVPEEELHHALLGEHLEKYASSNSYLIVFCIISIMILVIAKKLWTFIILSSINQDLSETYFKRNRLYNTILFFAFSLFTALTVNLIGVITLVANVVIPAWNAQKISKSPINTVIIASLFTFISLIISVLCHDTYNLPLGPTTVMINIMITIAIKVTNRLPICYN